MPPILDDTRDIAVRTAAHLELLDRKIEAFMEEAKRDREVILTKIDGFAEVVHKGLGAAWVTKVFAAGIAAVVGWLASAIHVSFYTGK